MRELSDFEIELFGIWWGPELIGLAIVIVIFVAVGILQGYRNVFNYSKFKKNTYKEWAKRQSRGNPNSRFGNNKF